MGISKDAVKAARAIAAVPTKARMRADVARASGSVQNLTRHFRDNLFERKLTVLSARRAIRSGDHSISTRFRNLHGKRPKRYICEARLEVGDRLLREFGLPVPVVAKAVGYDRTRTFSDHFEAFFGEDPEDVRGKDTVPEVDVATYRRVMWGEGDAQEVARVRARMDLMYDGDGDPPPPMVEGPGRERWQAADLWKDIRDMPFEEQRVKVRWHVWNTPALFDLLRRKSRQEGRKDRQVGIRLAELALISLERCTDWWTERIHDLRALGLAELAHARRLARDFLAAEAKFVESWVEWRTPRESPDPLVEAEICLLHGTLRMFQRQYDEALELVNRAISLFEAEDDSRGRAQALMQRAAIRGYIGLLDYSLADFRQAAGLLDEETEPFLAFGVSISVANALARLGRYEESRQELGRSRLVCSRSDYPLGISEIEWLEGFIRHETGDLPEAEKLYLSAMDRFVGAGELLPTALNSLDLTILYCEQQRYGETIEMATKTIPMLQSLKLHPETLEAIAMLAKAVGTREVSQSLLRRVREAIRQDPLSSLE